MARLVSNPDLLAAYAQFGLDKKIVLHEAGAVDSFAEHVRTQVNQALANPTLVHGQRTENMFEAMVIAFGKFRLLRQEDAGRVYPADKFEIPDFRIVLENGDQMLVEVKNHFKGNAFSSLVKFKPDYLDRMKLYAETVACELRIAIYWAKWGTWTLIAPDDLRIHGAKLVIDFMTAMRVSEMARLGDVTLGTVAPLQFRLLANKSQPRFVDESGQANILVGEVHLLCRGIRLIDDDDIELAWLLMQFGRWLSDTPTAIMDGELVDAVEYRWDPPKLSNQGFEMIGSASGLFSRFYATRTVRERTVSQTRAEAIPGWLSPILRERPSTDALPLWRFVQEPNRRPNEQPADASAT